jgi:hypothetical protein
MAKRLASPSRHRLHQVWIVAQVLYRFPRAFSISVLGTSNMLIHRDGSSQGILTWRGRLSTRLEAFQQRDCW